MGPLRNPRHEKFVKGLFEGLPASRAFVEAGYAPNDGNAIRLKGNERVQARLAELQGEAAKSAKITIQSICEELAEATAVAKAKGQAQAMVSASALRAKLAGLMVEKVEVGKPGEFEECASAAEVADRFFAPLIEQFKPVDEADRQGLINMFLCHLRETEEYLDAIKARPSVAERVDPRHLSKPWRELKPYGVPRLTNGRTKG